jgi:hypothetical protein
MARRERIADAEARQFVGVLYAVMAAHFDYDPAMVKKIKGALDWKGVTKSLSITLRRYADHEAHQLLASLAAPSDAGKAKTEHDNDCSLGKHGHPYEGVCDCGFEKPGA